MTRLLIKITGDCATSAGVDQGRQHPPETISTMTTADLIYIK
ncbi:MAG: hypothetical protein ACKVH8_10360 [Pirellulales bacterium]